MARRSTNGVKGTLGIWTSGCGLRKIMAVLLDCVVMVSDVRTVSSDWSGHSVRLTGGPHIVQVSEFG